MHHSCPSVFSIVRENTWNCVKNRRNCITDHSSTNVIIRTNCHGRPNNPVESRNVNLSTTGIVLVIQRQYRLCHSKKLYCILLYYEPAILLFVWSNINHCVHSVKTFKNVMCNAVWRQVERQRSRRRRRRRYLNSFCDNFKII